MTNKRKWKSNNSSKIQIDIILFVLARENISHYRYFLFLTLKGKRSVYDSMGIHIACKHLFLSTSYHFYFWYIYCHKNVFVMIYLYITRKIWVLILFVRKMIWWFLGYVISIMIELLRISINQICKTTHSIGSSVY